MVDKDWVVGSIDPKVGMAGEPLASLCKPAFVYIWNHLVVRRYQVLEPSFLKREVRFVEILNCPEF